MKEAYQETNFRAASLRLIEKIDGIKTRLLTIAKKFDN